MPAAPKTSTGFVSLSDYLNANQDAVNSTAQGLAGNVSQEAQKGQADAQGVARNVYQQAQGTPNLDPTQMSGYSNAQGELDNASRDARNLTNFGGLSQQLGQQNQSGAYSAGDRSFDANLLMGNQQLSGVAQKYGNLGNYLQDQTTAAQTQGANAPKAEGQGVAPASLEPGQQKPKPNPADRVPGLTPGNVKNNPAGRGPAQGFAPGDKLNGPQYASGPTQSDGGQWNNGTYTWKTGGRGI